MAKDIASVAGGGMVTPNMPPGGKRGGRKSRRKSRRK